MIRCAQTQARIGTENFSPVPCQSQRPTPRQPSHSAGFAYCQLAIPFARRRQMSGKSPAADRKFQFEFAKLFRSVFEAIALGGWYGYLRRDGSLSTPLKGGMWKGFFHTPRALWLCWGLLGEMLN